MVNYIKYLVILLLPLLMMHCKEQEHNRTTINLNGKWSIAKTNSFDDIPFEYPSIVQIPGLVDMASPSIDQQDTVYENVVYWYRRFFKTEDADIIRLKINKAKYYTKVYVNGYYAGENVYSFTPTQLDIKPYIHSDGSENELRIAVGCKNNLPDTVVNGNDFEKVKYIPGIYDDVSITLTSYPFISNIQTVPDIENGRLRIVAELEIKDKTSSSNLTYKIRELASRKIVSEGKFDQPNMGSDKKSIADFNATLDSINLWTPDNPFLYELELATSGDKIVKRFGMRSFTSTKESDVFLLNGKPYFMRGTNVCMFRFFEDPNRNGLPWDSKWITKLHNRFKDMHWNSIRYCIGFPPERWYEIADSLGFLIQDEFPVWTGEKNGFKELQKEITEQQLAQEYTQWMRERWNHPSVVIWDAQNESVTEVTGNAIRLVRSLDLSSRPWDNGYAAPVNETDAIESHPYLFVRYFKGSIPSEAGPLKDLLSEFQIPVNDPNEHTPAPDGKHYQNPIIVNEYGWLWLNRDGTPTTLTDRVYDVAFPEAMSKEQKYEVYAKHMAILTEYWRAYRKCAAIMHFCGLGYSRSENPRGQTSDNFIDLKELTFEPQFYEYVKPAFSPVGLMIELWDKSLNSGTSLSVPVYLINDLDKLWKGEIKLSLFKADTLISVQSVSVAAEAYEKIVTKIPLTLPDEKANYRLVATIDFNGEAVTSIREFKIK